MPLHGFGTWKSSPEDTVNAVKAALSAGYRHIDCAAVYMNEKYVGQALSEFMKETGTKREEIFVTSKVWNTCHAREDVAIACRQSLNDLQLDYVDLYLVHHPFAWKFGGLPITEENWVMRDEKGGIEWGDGASLEQTWRGMEQCVRMGYAKDIGVSNYSVMLLMDLLQYASIHPAVNQCEAHIYFNRKELREICAQFGVHFTMYSVLGSGKKGPLQDDIVCEIGKRKGISAAQVLIGWGLASGCSVLSKSSRVERAKENWKGGLVELSGQELEELNGLDRGLMTCNMVEYWGFASHA